MGRPLLKIALFAGIGTTLVVGALVLPLQSDRKSDVPHRPSTSEAAKKDASVRVPKVSPRSFWRYAFMEFSGWKDVLRKRSTLEMANAPGKAELARFDLEEATRKHALAEREMLSAMKELPKHIQDEYSDLLRRSKERYGEYHFSLNNRGADDTQTLERKRTVESIDQEWQGLSQRLKEEYPNDPLILENLRSRGLR